MMAPMPWGNAEIHAADRRVWNIEEARRRKASEVVLVSGADLFFLIRQPT
jgi:hypothetical protein